MARQRVLKASTRVLLKRYARILEESDIPVNRLILFGSRAKGNSRPWSDIDVCVVSKSFGKDLHGERVMLSRLASKIEPLIEPHPYHPDDLKNRYDPLAAEIRRSGRKLSF